jgi:hypothetical protein
MKAKRATKLLISVCLLAGAGASSAATLPFTENFDAAAATEVLNWAGNAKWTVTNGTVDLINNTNPWGIKCAGDAGKCVDLDGSTSDAGVLTTLNSDTIQLIKDQKYELSVEISGSQRFYANPNPPAVNDPNTAQFGLRTTGDANLFSLNVGPLAWNAPFIVYTLAFTADQTIAAKIFFASILGQDDNVGLIIDNISLKAVPLPAAAWLLLSGLAGVAALARRRRLAPVAA